MQGTPNSASGKDAKKEKKYETQGRIKEGDLRGEMLQGGEGPQPKKNPKLSKKRGCKSGGGKKRKSTTGMYAVAKNPQSDPHRLKEEEKGGGGGQGARGGLTERTKDTRSGRDDL